ncbi:uncharacterized protein LACBIDRAFT_310801 [Laccaria bicolor S238N-H82]|uniref:Predicted protein n=1 Tax=Laccaria bicolor (strain S238N-H82 / ATCC MYA-4686) TaxID=486041 RepID=B0DV40_LACBS|nr:uncharacterized protein LACBIDRAFT_310801 [Laccaria bicolor S238N-H82]EDR01511.1 predicted protein [Laccaria bicolor S238N-H82]|eukprot:XP_001887863.1 predicted protein [Laccaria bicolor S238N-H82]
MPRSCKSIRSVILHFYLLMKPHNNVLPPIELEVTKFGDGHNFNLIFGVPGIAVMRKSSHALCKSVL